MSKRSSSSDSSSTDGSYNHYPRYSSDHGGPVVVTLRCSRCAKGVEVVSSSSTSRVSPADLSASGMVSFGTNLYYCDRCANITGYR